MNRAKITDLVVHSDITHRIFVDLLVTKCRRLPANREPTIGRTGSHLPFPEAFQAFAVIEGNPIDIDEGNDAELSRLCGEFGCDGLCSC
jgi:hypothetical protein